MSSLKNDKNLSAFDGSGVESAPAPTGYVTLSIDSHYFEIPVADEGDLQSVQIITDATIAGVFTVESSNVPSAGPASITAYNEVVGWTPENPTSAFVGTGGTGWTVSALTLTKTAGVGSATMHLGNLGTKRCRIKAAISTGGTCRVIPHGKQ